MKLVPTLLFALVLLVLFAQDSRATCRQVVRHHGIHPVRAAARVVLHVQPVRRAAYRVTHPLGVLYGRR